MNSDYTCSLAYVKKETDEISSVDILLKVKNDKIMTIIKPIDDYYLIDDLEAILKEFQKTHLSRMKINIFKECEIYLDNSDAFRKVTLESDSSPDTKFKVAKIEEVERI